MAKRGRPRTSSSYLDSKGNVVARVWFPNGARRAIPLHRPPSEFTAALQALVNDYAYELVHMGALTVVEVPEAIEAILTHLSPDNTDIDALTKTWKILVDTRVAIQAVRQATVMLTFQEVAEMWLDGEIFKEYEGVKVRGKLGLKQARAKLRTYAFPVIGPLPINRVGVQEVKNVVDYARKTGKLGELSIVNLWDLCRRVVSLAQSPLNLIDRNPLTKDHRPKAKGRKGAQLTPTDDAQLMSCKKVSLHDRIWWGMLAREGTRVGELAALKWSALTRDGLLNVWHSKTQRWTQWELDESTIRALLLYRKLCGDPPADSPMFRPSRLSAMAIHFRNDLKTAGLADERPELWIDDDKQRHVVSHSLRALFITVALAGGKHDEFLRQRTAHSSERMQEHYKKDVDLFRRKKWTSFLALDKAIPELRALAAGKKVKRLAMPIRIQRENTRHLSMDEKKARRYAKLKTYRAMCEAKGKYSPSRNPAERRRRYHQAKIEAELRRQALLPNTAMGIQPERADAAE